MPAKDLMLQPEADWTPTEWASAEIQAVIGVRGAAELKRGINLCLSGEVGASIAALVANYVAVDVSAEAHASVELTGQAQILLDLFEEVGVAVRLRASAELGASVKLGIGLSTKEFMNLAKKTELIGVDTVPMELLEALLDETVIEAGVAGKAAFSAMAYANLSITGRLIRKSEADGAGFFLVGDFGAGLEGGAGYQMFAKVGLREPGRLIRRTVDIAVDRTIAELAPYVADIDKDNAEQAISLLWQLRAPAKMAMRMAYETGMALSKDSKKKIHENFSNKDIAKEVAIRCVKIAVEEAQPYVLELLMQWAIERFRIEAGLEDDAWDSMADLLVDKRPAEPLSVADGSFESNLAYWNEVVNTLDDLLKTKNEIQTTVAPYLAITWGAIQLLFIVAQFALASSREADAPETEITPSLVLPESVITAISKFLGEQAAVTINYEILLEFVTKKTSECFDAFVVKDSGAETILRILIGGEDREQIKHTLCYLIEHVGASYSLESQSKYISLKSVQTGLNWYMQDKVEVQLKKLVKDCDGDELLKNMFTDVLIASLAFTTDHIITAVLEYTDENETAIREACSAILMRLLARSLVVTTDVLVATAMQQIQTAMGDFDKHLDPVIDSLGKEYKTEHVASVLHQTVDISAKVFNASGAAYQQSRPEISDLLYKLIDGNMQFPIVDKIPHKDELVKLATHVAAQLEHNIMGFAKELLLRLGERLYIEFQRIVDDVKQQVEVWEAEISTVHEKIQDQIALIEQQLTELEKKIEESVAQQIRQTNIMIDYVSSHPEAIKQQLRNALHNEAMKRAPSLGKKAYEIAVDKAVDLSEPTISKMVVSAFVELKKDRNLINAFLKDARKFGSKKDIAESFGDHLGVVVARQLQVTIIKVTVKVPENAVRAAFRTGAGLTSELVRMAGPLIEFFKQQTESETQHQKTTEKSKVVNQRADSTQKLIDAKASDDARIEIISPSADAFISPEVEVTVKIRFIKIPVQYLSRQPLEQPRVLIWVNQILVDLHSVEPALQADGFILTFAPDSLRAGPNFVTVMVADSKLQKESLGFFMQVKNIEKEKGLGLSDSDITDSIVKAKTSLQEKSRKAIAEAKMAGSDL